MNRAGSTHGIAGTSPLWDVVVLGAGAAGLFCAGQAGQRGARVLVIDHAVAVAEKVRISGGGRCNFTNRDLDPAQSHRHFISQNPQFCRSALSRYTPAHFIGLMERHRLGYHEKHKGQLFCNEGSGAIIELLLDECAQGHVERWQPCGLRAVTSLDGADGARFQLETDRGPVSTRHLVVATGGLSIPKIGATDLGYRLARQFGHKIVEPRPALVPLTFAATTWQPFVGLAGLALPVTVRTGQGKDAGQFQEDLLFTHRGLSGPAILQISSYWQPGEPLQLDLLPGVDLVAALLALKPGTRKLVQTVLGDWLPERLAQVWAAGREEWARPLNDTPDRLLRTLAASLQAWQLLPDGTEGFRKAEVTRGGVDTRDLSSQSMESRQQPGLHFIGEVVDVTGWLGGYNFQWAWASAYACALAMTAQR